MMRSLWTAASGMTSQQLNVDNIANNLANVNTIGFKKETIEFKTLLYQNLQRNSYDSTGTPKPVGVEVGLGVRNSAISTSFKQGSLLASEGEFDYALEGEGFFTVRREDGSLAYTRNGSFVMALSGEGYMLTTTSGNQVLDVTGDPITLPLDTDINKVDIDAGGNLFTSDVNNNNMMLGIQIGVAQFSNPMGLAKLGESLYAQTDASGVAQVGAPGESVRVVSGYLEGANVQVVDEMVNLIVAQRAYEMNSKAITASDQMLQQANNLRN